jgi:hypothetical protein
MVVRLEEVTPPISRPTASHQRLGASAISSQSIAMPAMEIRITGRRPKRSESEPITGEARNCMAAQAATSMPFHRPALAREPAKASISDGRTGITSPMANMSRTAVTRMKAMAARRGRSDIGPM